MNALTKADRPNWATEMAEHLNESKCLELVGTERIGRLAYTGRYGLTVLPVLYKLYEGSVVFCTDSDTFAEEDLRTGIEHAEYHVAFEVGRHDPRTVAGWSVLLAGPAHHVDTEAEHASIINAGADPWPAAETAHFLLLRPTLVRGRRRGGHSDRGVGSGTRAAIP